jgi:hypothetical protein
MKLEINGADVLAGELAAFPEKLLQPVIEDLAEIAYDVALEGAGRHVVTGALFQSLYNDPVPGGRKVWHDHSRAPHAAFIQTGTRPHDIFPREKKALRWPKPGLGGFAFSRHVFHPGTEADPYFQDAEAEALGQLEAIVQRTLSEAFP